MCSRHPESCCSASQMGSRQSTCTSFLRCKYACACFLISPELPPISSSLVALSPYTPSVWWRRGAGLHQIYWTAALCQAAFLAPEARGLSWEGTCSCHLGETSGATGQGWTGRAGGRGKVSRQEAQKGTPGPEKAFGQMGRFSRRGEQRGRLTRYLSV